MSNFNVPPYSLLGQLYQPTESEQTTQGNFQGVLMLHQSIPPIVVNPISGQEPSFDSTKNSDYYPPPVSLGAGDPLRKPGLLQSSMPFLYGSVGQMQHQPQLQVPVGPPPPGMPFGPIQGPNPVYYMPPQVLPQFRSQYEAYSGSRPAIDRFAPKMPSKENQERPPPALQPYPPVMLASQGGQRSELPQLLLDEGFKTNFKPTRTKKNSRPKINMIMSDKYDTKNTSRKRQKIAIEEPCHDALYEHFRVAMAIDVSRADVTKMYEYRIQSVAEENLFDLFANNISIFIDVFLPNERFQKIVSELALYDDTRMILDSIFCLSSLILQRMRPDAIDPLCPLKYYQRSVNAIRYQLSLPEVENPRSGILGRCLLSTNLLCIYELFFFAIDSTYVKGAGSILMSILSKRIHQESLLKTSPFYDTCFWAMFICDLVLSLKLEAPSMYSLEKVWRPLDPEFFDDFESYAGSLEDPKSIEDAKDDYAGFIVSPQRTLWWQHKILLLYSAINLFCALSDVVTREEYESNKQFYQWSKLNTNLEEFGRHMPVYLKPLIYKPAVKGSFPVIYFKDEQTAIVALNYKLARLSLHVALCSKLRIEDLTLLEPEIAKYPSNYREKLAKDIAGIMQTYDCNLKIWPVNIHALRQASKYFERGTDVYEELKQLTIKVIRVCQTGLTIPSFVESVQ